MSRPYAKPVRGASRRCRCLTRKRLGCAGSVSRSGNGWVWQSVREWRLLQDLLSPLPIFVYRPRFSFHGPFNVPVSPLLVPSAVMSSKLIFGSEMRQHPIGPCGLPLAHDAREAEFKTDVIPGSSQPLGIVGHGSPSLAFTSWQTPCNNPLDKDRELYEPSQSHGAGQSAVGGRGDEHCKGNIGKHGGGAIGDARTGKHNEDELTTTMPRGTAMALSM